MKHEELVVVIVTLLRRARAQLLVRMTEGMAVRFKCQTTAFRQITTHALEALVHLHRVLRVLLSVWHRREHKASVLEQTLNTTVETVRESVLRWLVHTGNERHTCVLLAEVKGLDEITQLRATPQRHFLGVEGLAMRFSPTFKEHNLTLVGRMLRKHITTASPRRDDIERKAVAWTDGLYALELEEWIFHPFSLFTPRGVRGHDMVCPATCLVV